jgi:heterodisulfide reductase subunit A
LCVEECVFKNAKFDDEFNEKLGKRKPIYMPFPQATPPVVLIDPTQCLRLSKGKCASKCVDVCEKKAIDFEQKERIEEVEFGATILATGFQTFDAKRIPQYGYGKYANVYTSLELERLVKRRRADRRGDYPARWKQAQVGGDRALRGFPGP